MTKDQVLERENRQFKKFKAELTRLYRQVHLEGGHWTGEGCVILVCHGRDGSSFLATMNSNSPQDMIAARRAIDAYKQSLEEEPEHVGFYL